MCGTFFGKELFYPHDAPGHTQTQTHTENQLTTPEKIRKITTETDFFAKKKIWQISTDLFFCLFSRHFSSGFSLSVVFAHSPTDPLDLLFT